MTDTRKVASHYAHGRLVETITEALEKVGKTPRTVTMDDLAPVDEFHIGGRQASQEFLDQLGLVSGQRVLDVGSGLGGPARFTASHYGCKVTGIDLTADFVETARTLTGWLNLDDAVGFVEGSALELPFEPDSFDAAYMFHVGMNIADKLTLFAGIFRVLRPGGVFGIYDVMRVGDGALAYPVPWAKTKETCAIATPEDYKNRLAAAGFDIVHERNRQAFAHAFFKRMIQRNKAPGGPPPVGTHLLMGEVRAEMLRNQLTNIEGGRIAPVEIIARKPAG